MIKKSKIVLIVLNSVALIASLDWLYSAPGLEPAITCLGLLGTLIAQVVQSSESAESKEVARNIERFRNLFRFLRGLNFPDLSVLISNQYGWNGLLKYAGITHFMKTYHSMSGEVVTALIKKDGTYYIAQLSPEKMLDLSLDWSVFSSLPIDMRLLVADSLTRADMSNGITIYRNEQFSDIITSGYFNIDARTRPVGL